GVDYWRWGLFVLFMCPRVDDTEVGRGKGALGCLLVTGPTSRWPPACGFVLWGYGGPCCALARTRWKLDISDEVSSNRTLFHGPLCTKTLTARPFARNGSIAIEILDGLLRIMRLMFL